MVRYLRSLFSRRSGDTPGRGRAATDRLWGLLRTRELRGHCFKRQHPLGPFVVEYVCLEQALVIEIEHSRSAPHAATRRALLERLGYRVLWIAESEVLNDLKAVRRAIEDRLHR